MKRLLLLIIMTLMISGINAQEAGQTAQGIWLVEISSDISTSYGGGAIPPTGISLVYSTTEDVLLYSLGGEVGYFVIENLAIKAGLGLNGYTKLFSSNPSYMEGTDFRVSIGAKYYVSGNTPLELDYTRFLGGEGALLGIGAGYALYLGDHLALEPGIKYYMGLGPLMSGGSIVLRMGFSGFF